MNLETVHQIAKDIYAYQTSHDGQRPKSWGVDFATWQRLSEEATQLPHGGLSGDFDRRNILIVGVPVFCDVTK